MQRTLADRRLDARAAVLARRPARRRSASRCRRDGSVERRLSFSSYGSIPQGPLEPGAGSTAPLPSPRDLFCIANKAWRGVEARMYDEKRGVLVSGRDIIQWMVYHLRMPSDEETVVYLKRVAQEFINQRYIMRCSNSLLPAMFRHRKNRVNMKFSGGNKLYDFNDVSVSRLHVVVLIQGASGLMARDRSGTSDPVCQVLLGGTQSRQTRVISKNCYPIWNEVFTFGVRDVSAQQLVFKIYDYDVTSSDDFLGYARLPLSDILSESDLKQMRLQKMHEERQLSRMHQCRRGAPAGGEAVLGARLWQESTVCRIF